MRKLIFGDNASFYGDLKKSLKGKEQILIDTPYTNYAELPQKLIDIFELEKHLSSNWITSSGKFLAGAPTTPVSISYQHIYVFASAAVGGVAGLAIRGPRGAAIGAGIGAVIGMAAGAMASGKHKVEIDISIDGKIRFKVTPV